MIKKISKRMLFKGSLLLSGLVAILFNVMNLKHDHVQGGGDQIDSITSVFNLNPASTVFAYGGGSGDCSGSCSDNGGGCSGDGVISDSGSGVGIIYYRP